MKVVIWCLVLVGLYFIYQFTVGNVFREYQRCYEKAQVDIESTAATTSDANRCVVRKLAYDDMLTCFTTLQENNNLAGMLYDAAPTSKSVSADFDLHNDECPTHLLVKPQMTIYLNSGASR